MLIFVIEFLLIYQEENLETHIYYTSINYTE